MSDKGWDSIVLIVLCVMMLLPMAIAAWRDRDD